MMPSLRHLLPVSTPFITFLCDTHLAGKYVILKVLLFFFGFDDRFLFNHIHFVVFVLIAFIFLFFIKLNQYLW